VPKFVIRAFSLPAAIAERLKGNIKAYLVAILEAIRHRLCRAEYPHLHAFDHMLLDPYTPGLYRKTRNPKLQSFHLGDSSFPIDSQPYFKWKLGGKTMKTKRRKQANYAIGDLLAGFGQTVVLSNVCLRHLVKTSSQFFEPPLTGETNQVFPGDTV
jgi:hypothetical protein